MKKLALLFSTICLAVITSYAATITVSNNPNSPGQYTDLQTAIDSASAGDVILVAGSSTSYGSILINKKALHIKGVGYNPNKQVPLKATIANFHISAYSLTESGSGTIIEGIDCGASNGNDRLSGFNALNPLTNITIRRCSGVRLEFYDYVDGVLLNNNILTFIHTPSNGNTNNINNIIISNNILGSIQINSDIPNTIQSLAFKNNLIIGAFSGYGCINSIFSNNIFYYSNQNSNSITYCNFSNNLSFGGDSLFNINGTNNGGYNLFNQDPLFVNKPNIYYEDTDDFHTPTTSPVYSAGSDGTDLGIYGGTYPWPDGGSSGSGFMYQQEPQIPQVNEMDILTPIVPVGGNITVTAKGIVNH